jgi:hypothetical protein
MWAEAALKPQLLHAPPTRAGKLDNLKTRPYASAFSFKNLNAK